MNTDNLVVAVSYAHDSDEFNKKVVAFKAKGNGSGF